MVRPGGLGKMNIVHASDGSEGAKRLNLEWMLRIRGAASLYNRAGHP